MLTNTVAILHDNGGHGEDHYVYRTLNDNMSLDAVMDGVTGRRGWEASQALADALAVAPLTSPADPSCAGRRQPAIVPARLGRFFADDNCRCALLRERTAHRRRRRQPYCAYTAGHLPALRQPHQRVFARRAYAGHSHKPTARHAVSCRSGRAPGDRVFLATDGIADLIPRPELVSRACCRVPRGGRRAAPPPAGHRHAAAPLGSQGRRDDWTTIVRFFSS